MAEPRINGIPTSVLEWLRLKLQEHARGRVNAWARWELRAALGENGLPNGDRMVRRAIRQLIREGLPIGGGASGYWYCVNAWDLAEAHSQLKQRICQLARRDKQVREAYIRANGGQQELDFAEREVFSAIDVLAEAEPEGDSDE